jgi:hypothetical protein
MMSADAPSWSGVPVLVRIAFILGEVRQPDNVPPMREVPLPKLREPKPSPAASCAAPPSSPAAATPAGRAKAPRTGSADLDVQSNSGRRLVSLFSPGREEACQRLTSGQGHVPAQGVAIIEVQRLERVESTPVPLGGGKATGVETFSSCFSTGCGELISRGLLTEESEHARRYAHLQQRHAGTCSAVFRSGPRAGCSGLRS